MKERPILFSTPMVQAILAGHKTMTRRVIKPQPTLVSGDALGQPYIYFNGNPNPVKCPYGVPGDRLWVKETYMLMFNPYKPDEQPHVHYKANYPTDTVYWKPSMSMPRKYSRILLEITNVRVERVQQITHEDSIAEGCTLMFGVTSGGGMGLASPCYAFKKLWDKINAKRGYGWDINPWVWMIEFRTI